MKLIIILSKQVRDEDEARDTYNEITEALEHINPDLEIKGKVSTKLERTPS